MTQQPPFTEDSPILDRFRLDGRAALITGGAQGLGRGFAIALAQAGASVMIADINGDGAAATATELSDRGLTVASVPADVTDPDAIDAMISATGRIPGRARVPALGRREAACRGRRGAVIRSAAALRATRNHRDQVTNRPRCR